MINGRPRELTLVVNGMMWILGWTGLFGYIKDNKPSRCPHAQVSESADEDARSSPRDFRYVRARCFVRGVRHHREPSHAPRMSCKWHHLYGQT